MTAREIDENGWMEIKDNPISKVGVFPYLGSMIDASGEMGLDPDTTYQVYRSEAELSDQETLDSFKLVPWVDDHLMLGKDFDAAEAKGIQGVIGEDVHFEDGYLLGNIKLFSDSQAQKVEDGKTELSCGYRCEWEIKEGVFGDQKYGVVQTKIRGNHLASVDEGRMGSEVAVLDHLTFAVDTKDFEIMKGMEKKTLDDYGRDGVEESEYGDVLQMIAGELSEMKSESEDHGHKHGAKDDEDADRDLGQDADEDEDDDEKKSEDTKDDDDDDDEKKGEDMELPKHEGMDALDAKVTSLEKDFKSQKRSGVKSVMREIRQRDALYAKVSPSIGAFDHADMTTDELAAYACDKLDLSPPKGHEVTALDSYFTNRVPIPVFGTDSINFRPSVAKANEAIDNYFAGEA